MNQKPNFQLAQAIDQTLLKPEATSQEIATLLTTATEYEFASVCINPCFVKQAAAALKNSNTKVCTVIGFPLGANTTVTKVFEAQQAISDGANELDMVINIGALKALDEQTVLTEIIALKKICPKDVILKVIIETSKLTDDEKIIACRLVTQAQADFIKTSTGFGGGGATIADIKLMKANIGPDVKIKASGGIRNYADAIAMLKVGASRLGTSNGVAIIEGSEATENY